MTKWILSCVLVFFTISVLNAQVEFKTLVTPGPVIVGEPFQVQYVLENIDGNDEFIPPKFRYFHLVNGPNVYIGSMTTNGVTRNLRNMIYTLAAKKPGKYMVPGATAMVDGKLIHSDNAAIEVISRDEAESRDLTGEGQIPNLEFYLRPGEDPYEKIKRNLFMKVVVDRRTCYVGQPVTATFKLYSRLQSRSDIVKNPGFYGFTVQDIINLNHRRTEKELVDGKKFDVHTIRKVQLYPLQAGTYTIDAMELQNKVAFSKNAVGKKTEQEIVEGIFADPDDFAEPNTVVYENNMHTEALKIEVKPVPESHQPADFNGATGRFRLDAFLTKNEVESNEEAELVVNINGRGNFTQLLAPTINWPSGLEGFEPEIKDSLDHNFSPMAGQRIFSYRVVAAKPGQYTIPSVTFSFFDPDSNRYKTVTTAPQTLTVRNSLKNAQLQQSTQNISNDKKSKDTLVLIVIASAFVLSVIGFRFWWKKNSRIPAPDDTIMPLQLPGVNQLLHKASILSQTGSRTFYVTLRTAIWDFLNAYFGLSGTRMSKQELIRMMEEKNIAMQDRNELVRMLEECEANIFTQVDIHENHQAQLELTRELLERIRRTVA